jgi:site-specific DNA recombinase
MIAAIYARKSTDDSGESCARQVEHAIAFARSQGWTVPAEFIFTDDGISGAEFERRPGLVALLSLLPKRGRSAPYQMLVVSEISRLGREQFQTGFVLGQLAKAEVRVFTYLTGHEASLTDATGKFMLAVGTFADEMEREKARQRTRDALVRKARQGFAVGGKIFGYDNVRHDRHSTRMINCDEAAVVERIFTMIAAGTGVRSVAHRLNADRVIAPRPSKSGPRGWCPSTIRAILGRSIYRGTIEWGRTSNRTPTGG